jgi:phosphatidate cytidylyltransferase
MATGDPALAAEPPAEMKRRAELVRRIVAGAILALLALSVAYLGGWLFPLFWCVAAVGVLWEWTRLAAGAPGLPGFAGGFAALMFAAPFVVSGQFFAALALVVIGAVAAVAVVPVRRIWNGAGVLYAGILLLAPVLLRNDPAFGLLAILYLFAVVWVTDIAAYFVGRRFGGPKLAPALSPGKTWSGALGGLAGGVLAGTLVAAAGGLSRVLSIAILSLLLSVVAQVGDLFESAVKRQFGAKDSGTVIPGHGGLMDRLDSFLAVALAAAVMGMLRGGTEAPARGLLVW